MAARKRSKNGLHRARTRIEDVGARVAERAAEGAARVSQYGMDARRGTERGIQAVRGRISQSFDYLRESSPEQIKNDVQAAVQRHRWVALALTGVATGFLIGRRGRRS